MRQRARILPFLSLLLTIGAVPAHADPVGPCTSDSRSLTAYGPCVYLQNYLLSNISARVGVVDVTASDQLGMTFNVDAYPPEAQWLLFNIPVTGSLGPEVSSSTPLEVAYRLTGLNGSTISSIDLALLTAFGNYPAGIEFSLTSESGMTTHRLGAAGEPTRIAGPLAESTTSLDVLVRVFGTSPGGHAVGLFISGEGPSPVPDPDEDPAPVPEPGTFALLGSGLALLARARRRLSPRGSTGR